jgi:Fe-S-cluster containining protein
MRAVARLAALRRGAHGFREKQTWAFECTKCGRCCQHDGERRVVVSSEEVVALSRLTALPPAAFLRPSEPALQSRADGACVFLDAARRCSVYAARPTQCRTYPWWPELVTPLGWLRERARCEGIDAPGADVPAAEVAMNVVLSDLALSGANSTYDADRALLEDAPAAVLQEYVADILEADVCVQQDDAELCVVDSRGEDGRMRRTLVLKNAPSLDQSVAFLTAPSGRVVPTELAMPVHRALVLSALLPPRAPARVLVIGGGGCAVPLALAEALPNARITVVELSSGVASAARTWFGADKPAIGMVVCCGAAFVQAARRDGDVYDLILLDAASESASPAHALCDAHFVAAAAALLTDRGVLAANCFGGLTPVFEGLIVRFFGQCSAALPVAGSSDGIQSHTIVFGQHGGDRDGSTTEAWRQLFADAHASPIGQLTGTDVLQHAARTIRPLAGSGRL